MKLIYIANLRLPTEKAYGIQIAKTCESLAGLGTDLCLLSPYRISKIKDDFFEYYGVKKNFKFKRIWTPDFYLPGKLNEIAFHVKNFISAVILNIYVLFKNPDIVYSRDELPLYILSFFKRNVVFEAHRFSKAKRIFYKRFKRANIKVVVITNLLKDEFVKFGLDPKNILVAPDGVDLEEFDIDVSGEEARKKVGLPLDKQIVMYTGHLYEWKGASVLLEAARLSKVNGQLSNVLYVFVGGTEYDVANFKKKAEGLDNVLILGHRPRKNIPIYLKAADILVLPNSAKEEISRSYTSPLKLFEYMASGRPIVASDLPSIREILNNDNSFLVIPDNAEKLTDGIELILTNPNLSSKYSSQAVRDVQNFTWTVRVNNILNFFDAEKY